MAGLESLDALLEEELKDMYDAEKQLTKALPKLAKKATAPALREAFETHLRETEQHIERLEQVFEQLELPARGKRCVGMRNLIKEGDEMIAEAEDATRDAVMIAAAQKVEHYEIASYGTASTWAALLGHQEVASLFEQTLEEEKEADHKLAGIAEGFVNQAAAEQRAEDEEREAKPRQARGRSRRRVTADRETRQHAADRRRR
jgi:ferritin-like metal-binding protein YciE